MFGGPHIYQHLSLTLAGLCVALYLIGAHTYMLLKPQESQALLKKLPRDHKTGQILLAVGLAWFWLIVAPLGPGFLNKFGMDLGEFNGIKPILRIAIPVTFFLVATQVKEFLFVRALGIFAMMVAAPLLAAAFQKEPSSRVLVSFFCYMLIIKGLFWVGMPYLFRDAVNWATANLQRYKILTYAGLAYGVIVLLLSITAWRGH